MICKLPNAANTIINYVNKYRIMVISIKLQKMVPTDYRILWSLQQFISIIFELDMAQNANLFMSD